jgi:hypothetical protein
MQTFVTPERRRARSPPARPAPRAAIRQILQPVPPAADAPATLPDTGPGEPLPRAVRSDMEARLGRDFGAVRIHTGPAAAAAARQLHARAFTHGRDLAFGAGQYAPGTAAGRRLLVHELVHTIQQGQGGGPIQRAETDDNPVFCFPPRGTPLRDSRDTLNGWIDQARAIAAGRGPAAVESVYQALGHGSPISRVEQQLAALPATELRTIEWARSRYAGTMMWPVDPLTRAVLAVAGKIYVAPLINLCGVCVGTDKVGHFFQQGYEYYRLAEAVRARIAGLDEGEQRALFERLTGGPQPSPEAGEGGPPPIAFTLPVDAERIADAYTAEFGRWLEGFEHRLNDDDVRWIRRLDFIPFYYNEGVYGSASTGVLSRADLQANRQGFHLYQDLWRQPGQARDICDYVGELWNEYLEFNTFVPEIGTPTGPASTSTEVEEGLPPPLAVPPRRPALSPALPAPLEILFRFDRPQAGAPGAFEPSLAAEGHGGLDALIAQLRADPGLKVQLVGKASAEGPPPYNVDLSLRRAAAVAAALEGAGIARSRIADPPAADLDPACRKSGPGVAGCGALGANRGARDRQVLARFFRTP